MSLLTLLLREHLFDNRYLFSAVEPVGRQELQLASRLDCRVVTAELDAVDFLAKLINTILNFFDPSKVVLLALVCQFLKLAPLDLGQLVVPLGSQMLRDLSLAEMRHPLLHIIEVLVLENLVP